MSESQVSMSAKKKDEPEDDVLDIVVNSPEKVRYRLGKSDEFIEIEVSTLTVWSIEKAVQPLIKVLAAFNFDTGILSFPTLSAISSQKDMQSLMEVIGTCISIPLDDFKKLPALVFAKVVEVWLRVNRSQLGQFNKVFLGLKAEAMKYKEVFLPQEKK